MKKCRIRIDGNIHNAIYDIDTHHIKTSRGHNLAPEEVEFLPPINPSKILCVGLNYHDALEARNAEPPPRPLIRVMKPASCLVGHLQPIVKPHFANNLFLEGELGVIIGRRCRNVAAKDWQQVVGGYTIFNDLGVRDSPSVPEANRKNQFAFADLIRSKGSDSFGPVGPWVEDELDPSNLRLRSFINDQLKQDSTTAKMVFKIPELIEYISSFMTLEPEDLISSGTPAGACAVNPGDTITIEIDGLGKLVNSVITA
jgi:5-oxopent-3-ene-1,2,5-tricarboxylate decarboxylase/2-hydroxyhepta-2,4-diene-1,7-dioate isomerase